MNLTIGRLLALCANIRISWKYFRGSNTLAYFALFSVAKIHLVYLCRGSVTNKKSFITSTTGLAMSTWKTQGQLKNINTKVKTNLYALPFTGMEQRVFNYIFIDY